MPIFEMFTNSTERGHPTQICSLQTGYTLFAVKFNTFILIPLNLQMYSSKFIERTRLLYVIIQQEKSSLSGMYKSILFGWLADLLACRRSRQLGM